MKRLLGFEHKSAPVAPRRVFLRRLGRNGLVALGIIAVSLVAGMAGYMLLEGKDLITAYDNAAMILSGMGPFEMAATPAGRLFEGTYAIYSGLVVVLTTGLILAPVFHRVLHRLHVDDDTQERGERRGTARH